MDDKRVSTEEPMDALASPLRALMRYERFHLYKPEMFRNAPGTHSFDVRYLPENCGVFELPCFWISKRQFYLYGTAEANGISAFFDDHVVGPEMLFPVHPAELPQYTEFLRSVGAKAAGSSGARLLAAPTSSTRTLLTWPESAPGRPFFLKLSLHSRIYGDRRIRRDMVAGAIGLSAIVEESQDNLPTGLTVLFEREGFAPRKMPDSGVIVRTIPQALQDGETMVAPLFALLGGSGAFTPLLLSIVRQLGSAAFELFEREFCTQFARIWVEMAIGSGLILEAHAQNLMLVMSPELTPKGGFVYRDCEGFTVDWELRRALGIPVGSQMPNSFNWHRTYGSWDLPMAQLASFKLRTSLFDYVFLFLHELDCRIREWRHEKCLYVPTGKYESFTHSFSRAIRAQIKDRYGVSEGQDYDLYESLNRFVIFLMKLRRDLLNSGSKSRT
jgi:hypothetical protein